MRRAFRFRLSPSPQQEEILRQFIGVTRLVYNLALEQRRDHWRQYRAATGGWLNFASQGLQVTQLRAEVPWIGAVPVAPLTQALRDLDRAMDSFFAGRARFPKSRKRGLNDSMRFQWKDVTCRPINAKWSAIHVPKLGWIKFRVSRAIVGVMQNVTISAGAAGWHVSFAGNIEHEVPANDYPAIGIDRGIAQSLMLSNGEAVSLPGSLKKLDRRKRRAQRALARCKRGSGRYQKRRRRVAKLAAKIGRIRRDWHHRVSTDIAGRFGAVALEDLNIKGMSAGGTGKRGLNRSILEQGWGAFAAMLAYKLEERGGTLALVNPAHTSQTCSDCGAIDRESRKSQAAFICTSCGFALNADHNAAVNILRRSTPVTPVEGRGCAPDEAGTSRIAA